VPVNADFEGQVDTCAPEIINVFRVFPARTGGVLALTAFANMDPETVDGGIVYTNAFDAILEGSVRPRLDGLYAQLVPYLDGNAHDNTLCHAQFCRDFSVLWRVLMGLTLFTSPEEGAGEWDEVIHRELAGVMGDMHRTASNIQVLARKKTMSFIEELRLRPLLEKKRTHVFPLTLARVIYRSTGNNRMSTWVLSFGRLRSPLTITQVAEQLWQLYSRSPLTVVSPSGKVRAYHAR
jgi:hypothetical protein